MLFWKPKNQFKDYKRLCDAVADGRITVVGALIIFLANPPAVIWFVIFMIVLYQINIRMIRPYMIRVGVEDKFGKSGKVPPLLEMYGLTVENMVAKAKAAIALKK